ncbi:hypothetical protein PpBr36_00351, partial [Pyricularia pennisetigena]|uniref:hypothetical protein n=1 Tax=Pyricularia pennisetigena TaxID=1578925 RepID=UPI0011543FE3
KLQGSLPHKAPSSFERVRNPVSSNNNVSHTSDRRLQAGSVGAVYIQYASFAFVFLSVGSEIKSTI